MNREVEAKLKLTATDASGAAFASLQRRMSEVDKRAEAVSRAERRRRMADYRFEESIGAAARANIDQRRRAAEAAAQRYRAAGRMIMTGAVAGGYMGVAAFKSYAELERRMNRIGDTADATKTEIARAFGQSQEIANKYGLSLDDVLSIVDTLVVSGRNMSDAMDFSDPIAAVVLASDAASEDAANTADAVARSLKISSAEMQKAFDIMITGTKAGKFEFEDMSRYIPSLAPAFAALGYEGTEGLTKLVAMLETVRLRTGSSSEAATAFQNILQKIESEETANKFRKNFGIDLRKEMAAARKDGKDLIEVFLDLTAAATKGDLSKLPLLFTDAQFQIGMRALLQGRTDMEGFVAAMSKADGSTLESLGKFIDDNTSKIQRMSNAWDRFSNAVGATVAGPLAKGMDFVSETIDRNDAINRGLARRGIDSQEKMEKEFGKENMQFDWTRNQWTPSDAIMNQLEQEGRGAGLKGDLPGKARKRRREDTATLRTASASARTGDRFDSAFSGAAPAAEDAAARVESAFAHIDLASAAERSGESYRAGLASAGAAMEAEARRIMDNIAAIMARPIRPNIQMPSAGPGSTGRTMADVVP